MVARIEPGLVDLLVREVRNDPGALPLMSHALLETWRRREGSTLTVAGYRASGGINGAVAQSAEGLYSRVGAERRDLLRDLVLRLVSPGLQGEPVRTRVPRRLVGTDPEHERLIEMLVAARLVTSDDGALEITHEALTFLDGGTPETLGAEVVITTPGHTRRRTWAPHPACGCTRRAGGSRPDGPAH